MSLTPTDISLVITAVSTAVLAWWAAYSSWRTKADAAAHQNAMEEREQQQQQRREEWEEDERKHRRKMEELAAGAVRAGNLAAKVAGDAVKAATTAKEEISESRKERAGQFEEIKQDNRAALSAANNFHGRVNELEKRLPPPAAPEPAPPNPS